jgi:hypothetical protein
MKSPLPRATGKIRGLLFVPRSFLRMGRGREDALRRKV